MPPLYVCCCPKLPPMFNLVRQGVHPYIFAAVQNCPPDLTWRDGGCKILSKNYLHFSNGGKNGQGQKRYIFTDEIIATSP